MAETDRPIAFPVKITNWRAWLPQAGVMAYLVLSIIANIVVPVSAFHTVEGFRFNAFFLPYLVGLFYLGASLWIFSIRRQQTVGRIFTAFCASVALVFGGIFVLKLTPGSLWVFFTGVGIVFCGACFIDFAFQFPQEGDWIARNPIWRLVPYGIASILAALILTGQNALFFALDVVFACASIVFGLAWQIFRRAKSPSPVEREQINVVLLTSLVSLGPVILSFLTGLIFPEVNRFFSFILVTLAIFPIMVGYTIQRHRLTHSNFILSQTLLFGFMAFSFHWSMPC